MICPTCSTPARFQRGVFNVHVEVRQTPEGLVQTGRGRISTCHELTAELGCSGGHWWTTTALAAPDDMVATVPKPRVARPRPPKNAVWRSALLDAPVAEGSYWTKDTHFPREGASIMEFRGRKQGWFFNGHPAIFGNFGREQDVWCPL